MIKSLNFFFYFLSTIALGQQFIHDSIQIQGNYRSFYVYVPSSYNANSPTPLVFSFHGYGSSAEVNYQYTQFHSIADTAGFILIHPQGSLLNGTSHWNVGGWTLGSSADDIGFTNLMLNYVESNFNIDQNRIYSTGMSNGGYMSFKLACELNEKFAAIASVTGSMTPQTLNSCNPVHPTPVLQIHGTADGTVPYQGSPTWTLGIQAVLDYWISMNSCNVNPQTISIDDINNADGSTVDYFIFDGGIDNVTVEHFRVNGGDHDWPGVWGNMDINASKEVWRFFYKHSKSSTTLNVEGSAPSLPKETIKIMDFMGREIKADSKVPQIHLYKDGTTSKVIPNY